MRCSMNRPVYISIFLIALILLYSCGGGGGGGTDLLAGGGISGTGKYTGVISGFGSIFVNGIEFDTSKATILVEGKPATEGDLSVGMKVTLTASNSKAEQVNFEPELKGEITGIDSATNTIEVLGQPVQITTATVLSGFTSIADLFIGDYLLVSGFFNSNSTVVATYVRLLTQPPSVVEVKGYVKNLDILNKTFEINTLSVDYSSITPSGQLNNGDFVEVKGSYSSGVLTATYLEITDPVENGSPGDTMKIEGIITSYTSSTSFHVNGIPIITTADTRFHNGSPSELMLNVWIEVKGKINDSGELVATQIEFRYNGKQEVELKGMLNSVNHAQSTVTIFNKTVKISSSTIFKDDSSQGIQNFTFSDLNTGDYVEIGGFVNKTGEIIATKIERIDSPTENILKGPVDPGSKNNTPGNSSVGILGITVDLNAQSIIFEDVNDNTIDISTFFSIIDDSKHPGDIVEVEGSFSQSDGKFYPTKVKIEKIN